MTSFGSAPKPLPEGERTRRTIVEHKDALGTYWTLKDRDAVDVEVFWGGRKTRAGFASARRPLTPRMSIS